MVIYRTLTAAVVDNNFHQNYDRRCFLPLGDTRRVNIAFLSVSTNDAVSRLLSLHDPFMCSAKTD